MENLFSDDLVNSAILIERGIGYVQTRGNAYGKTGTEKNHYNIWCLENGDEIVTMKVNEGLPNETEVMFDLVDLEKIKGNCWRLRDRKSKERNSYIVSDALNIGIHNYIMDYRPTGPALTGITVDHIDKNPRNNIRNNLRFATPEEQLNNRRGYEPGTLIKRKQKKNVFTNKEEFKKMYEDAGYDYERFPKFVSPKCGYTKTKNGRSMYCGFAINNHPNLGKGKSWSISSMKKTMEEKWESTLKKLAELYG